MRRILLLLLVPGFAFGADLEIMFDAPTTRVDGSLLSADEISHYNLCVDDACSAVQGPTTIADAVELGVAAQVTVQTVLTNGLTSEVVTARVPPLQPPSPPSNLSGKVKVTITIEVE